MTSTILFPEPRSNRYAWTNFGPVVIPFAGHLTTAATRAKLATAGVIVDRWARNHAAFYGWQPLTFHIPHPYGAEQFTPYLGVRRAPEPITQ